MGALERKTQLFLYALLKHKHQKCLLLTPNVWVFLTPIQ